MKADVFVYLYIYIFCVNLAQNTTGAMPVADPEVERQ